jgi:hypothetical protein
MKRAAVAILTLLTLAPIAEGVGPKPILLCEVLAHPDEHMGEPVIVRGTVAQYEHGGFLEAMPPCEQEHFGIPIQGTDTAAYFAAGGRKGVRVLAIVEGELVMSRVGMPQFTQTPYLAFSAKNVKYERPRNKLK